MNFSDDFWQRFDASMVLTFIFIFKNDILSNKYVSTEQNR